MLFCFYSLQSYYWGFAAGNLYGPSGTSCDIIRLKLDAYMAVCNGPIESGQWRYSIKIYLPSPSLSTVHFDVWLESEDFPILSTWTSAQHQQLVDWKSSPLVIYAQIHQRRRPVSNVQLVAKLIADGADFVEIPLDETNFAGLSHLICGNFRWFHISVGRCHQWRRNLLRSSSAFTSGLDLVDVRDRSAQSEWDH